MSQCALNIAKAEAHRNREQAFVCVDSELSYNGKGPAAEAQLSNLSEPPSEPATRYL